MPSSDQLRDEVAALVSMTTTERLERLRSELFDQCDVAVVTKPANIRWLTGFTGSNGLVAVAPHRLVLVTDERYSTQAAEQVAAAEVDAEVRIGRRLYDLIDDVVSETTVGVEGHHITWDDQLILAELVRAGSVISVGPLIEKLRRGKDQGELARLKLACRIADAALADALVDLGAGRYRTEQALAVALEQAMAERGAEDRSFPTIVASGPNSALPHARPSGRVLGPGDLLVIDMGAKVDGYGSDMTRSFVIGEFTSQTERMYRAVEESQLAGVRAVAAGVGTGTIHSATSSVLQRHGLGDYFIHGTGHGIGLEIHESPFLSSTSDDTLRTGYVVTVEPGVYIPGVGGVRIEDSVLVTEDGCRRLTNHPKDPVLSV